MPSMLDAASLVPNLIATNLLSPAATERQLPTLGKVNVPQVSPSPEYRPVSPL